MKKVVLSIVLSIYSIVGFSQSENNDVDSKIRFGFNLGGNYSILLSKESLPSGTEIYNGVGLKIGLFMDYSLSKNLLFSPKTELSFNYSGIEKINNDNSITSYQVYPVSLDVMTHFVYKIGDGKVTPYILAGPNFKLPLIDKSESSTELKSKPNFAIDFGVGLENRIKYFIFAPEIRYSLGLLNINKNSTFKTLNYHNISLTFNFK